MAPRKKSADRSSTPQSGAAETWGPRARTAVSIWLAAHFLILAIAYSGLSDRSRLQLGLLRGLRPYTQWTQLDPVADPPPFPFHWTDGGEFDTASYSIEWLPEGAAADDPRQWREVLVPSAAGLPLRNRQAAYGRAMAYFADFDELPGKLALAAAEYLLAREQRPSRIRCLRRFTPEPDSGVSADDPGLAAAIYEAAVLLDAQPVRILKFDPADETASPSS